MSKVFKASNQFLIDASNNKEMVERAKKILVWYFGKKHEGQIWSLLDDTNYIYYDASAKNKQNKIFKEKVEAMSSKALGFSHILSYFALFNFLKTHSNEQLLEMKNRDLLQEEERALIMFVPCDEELKGTLTPEQRLKKFRANKQEIIDRIVSNRYEFSKYIALQEFCNSARNITSLDNRKIRTTLLSKLLDLVYGPDSSVLFGDQKTKEKAFEMVNIYREFKDENALNLSFLPNNAQGKFIALAKIYAEADAIVHQLKNEIEESAIEDVYSRELLENLLSAVKEQGTGDAGEKDVGEMLDMICNMSLNPNEIAAAMVYGLGNEESLQYKFFCTLFEKSSNRVKIHELLHVVSFKLIQNPDPEKSGYVAKSGVQIGTRAVALNEILTDYMACDIDSQMKNEPSTYYLRALGPSDDGLKGYSPYFPLVSNLLKTYKNEFKQAYITNTLDPILNKIGKANFYELADKLDEIAELSNIVSTDDLTALSKDPENVSEGLARYIQSAEKLKALKLLASKMSEVKSLSASLCEEYVKPSEKD